MVPHQRGTAYATPSSSQPCTRARSGGRREAFLGEDGHEPVHTCQVDDRAAAEKQPCRRGPGRAAQQGQRRTKGSDAHAVAMFGQGRSVDRASVFLQHQALSERDRSCSRGTTPKATAYATPSPDQPCTRARRGGRREAFPDGDGHEPVYTCQIDDRAAVETQPCRRRL